MTFGNWSELCGLLAVFKSSLNLDSRTLADPFTLTAHELQELLCSGKLTSMDLIDQSQNQIELYDGYLKAILATSPLVMDDAKRLHQERCEGNVRGPLHGIPILMKDNIATDDKFGMDTTAGSYALVGSRPRKNATIIDNLCSAGAIILAKTQLSELASSKGLGLPAGWSALGCQTQSAYTTDDVQDRDLMLGHSNPSGSSTGSAVGVSAGYAPVSIGTDTTGSVIMPAARAALYGLRATTGIIPTDGIIPVSKTFDSVGVMSKCVLDLASLLDIIIDKDLTNAPGGGYSSNLDRGWRTLQIGVLDPEKWTLPPMAANPNPKLERQINDETKAAYVKIKGMAEKVSNVELISLNELQNPKGKSMSDLLVADFKPDLESYLSSLESSQVKSLQELIDFNEAHRSEELPEGYSQQDILIGAMNNNMSSEERSKLLAHVRYTGRDLGIDKTLEDNKIDAIIGPADSGLNMIVGGAGYPSATMPLSYADFNGRPFGLMVITKSHGEHLLLQVLKAFEDTFPPRKSPKALFKHSSLI